MANEPEAFMSAIIETPEDDTPRLIYADWLEEHGQPERAEFIRVQCELATIAQNDPRRPELEGREQELFAAHGAEWMAGIPYVQLRSPENDPLTTEHVLVQRGFIGRAVVDGETAVQHGEALGQQPLACLRIQNITLSVLDRLRQNAIFQPVRHLRFEEENLQDVVNTRVASILARSPHTRTLQTLDFGNLSCRSLAASEIDPVHRVNLSGYQRTFDALSVIGQSTKFRTLQCLKMRDAGMFSEIPNPNSLINLQEYHSRFTSNDERIQLAALLRGKKLPALRIVHVSRGEIPARHRQLAEKKNIRLTTNQEELASARQQLNLPTLPEL